MKIVSSLAVDTLAIIGTWVISVGEGGLAGETLKDVMVDIERKIVP